MTTTLVQYRLRSIDTTNKHFWHIRVQAKIKIDRKIASPIVFHTAKRKQYKSCASQKITSLIVHFTVVCLVAKPLNRNEAKGDLVMIQTLLLFKCKLLCYHAN